MTINLSTEMITVIAAIINKTSHAKLRSIRCGDDYVVDGIEAQDLFNELRKEAHRLYKGVSL